MLDNRSTNSIDLPRAQSGDEKCLVMNLVRNKKIGMKMLLKNLNNILSDDPNLLVEVVLLITDPKRMKEKNLTESDYADALGRVESEGSPRTKYVLADALNHAAKKAGFLALAS